MDLEGRINCRPIGGSASVTDSKQYEYVYSIHNIRSNYSSETNRLWDVKVPDPLVACSIIGATVGLLYGAWSII